MSEEVFTMEFEDNLFDKDDLILMADGITRTVVERCPSRWNMLLVKLFGWTGWIGYKYKLKIYDKDMEMDL